jgi:hypothetical protein
MRNIHDLTESMMDTIELLKNGKINTDAANAVANLGKVVVEAAKTEVVFLRNIDQSRSEFLQTPELKEAVEAAVKNNVLKIEAKKEEE